MQCSPASYHFIPLGSKYFPQYPVLKRPQSMFLPSCQRPSFTPIQNYRHFFVRFKTTYGKTNLLPRYVTFYFTSIPSCTCTVCSSVSRPLSAVRIRRSYRESDPWLWARMVVPLRLHALPSSRPLLWCYLSSSVARMVKKGPSQNLSKLRQDSRFSISLPTHQSGRADCLRNFGVYTEARASSSSPAYKLSFLVLSSDFKLTSF
jgi:hypothetical protein